MKGRARSLAARLLLLLLLAAAAERRLADLDLNEHVRSLIENGESVRGEEVRYKLIALHDFVTPRPLLRSEAIVSAPAPPAPSAVVRVVFDPESPRAPPVRHPHA